MTVLGVAITTKLVGREKRAQKKGAQKVLFMVAAAEKAPASFLL